VGNAKSIRIDGIAWKKKKMKDRPGPIFRIEFQWEFVYTLSRG
jgi:hypothetical protein